MSDISQQLTAAEIAKELKCHHSAPIRWIQKGAILSNKKRIRLKAIATPGGWRVLRGDLDEFLAAVTLDRLRDIT